MEKISLSREQIINLLIAARRSGTVEGWIGVALQWMEGADAALDAAEARIAQARADVDVGMKVIKEQVRRAAYEDAANVADAVGDEEGGAYAAATAIRERATAKPEGT